MQLVFKQPLKFQKHDFAFDWSCIYQTNQSLNKMETMSKNMSKTNCRVVTAARSLMKYYQLAHYDS